MARYRDIPQFTSEGSYAVDMEPRYLVDWIQEEITTMGLNMCPDFQRGHVWTGEQQKAYIEYCLRGGRSGMDLYFNCPWWNDGRRTGDYQEYVCVDGLQRITAWMAFLENKIDVFGYFYRDFTDRWPCKITMRVHVNNLQTRREVLRWYIDMNAGGTPHTKAEIERVRELLGEEKEGDDL